MHAPAHLQLLHRHQRPCPHVSAAPAAAAADNAAAARRTSVATAWRVVRAAAASTSNNGTQQQQSRRRKHATTSQQQSRRRKHATTSQQQHLQQQHLQQPDPAADDLDVLVAAAAAATTTPPTAAGTPHQAAPQLLLSSPITSIPEPRSPYAVPAGRQPRYSAADKLQLSGEAGRDIAARLRRARPARGSVLRVFRYGVDDLRLYKAVDAAGLEGRVVVVDATADADAVLTTLSKRTGKNVNQAAARRAAAGGGLPLLVLRAVSAQRLLEAVGPLLGLQQQDEGPSGDGQEEQGQDAGSWCRLGDAPRLLRWEEVEGDGSEELLALMWGAGESSSSSAAGGACAPSPRWRAWCAGQAASPALGTALAAEVRGADVEDARDALVPANPSARVGQRHRLMKPLRPYSRQRRRRLRRDLALAQADW